MTDQTDETGSAAWEADAGEAAAGGTAAGGTAAGGTADRERLLTSLELAFSADPVMRWFWPDPSSYRAHFRRFALVIGGPAFDHGTAFSADDGRAVALWLPPGATIDDDALVEIMLGSVAPELLEDLSAFADVVREHHPEYEHWYLPITGVDPIAQGKGLGATLLREALAACDRDGLPAYLEASTVRSRALYERFGFRQVGVIQAGTSPTTWSMLRDPVRPTGAS